MVQLRKPPWGYLNPFRPNPSHPTLYPLLSPIALRQPTETKGNAGLQQSDRVQVRQKEPALEELSQGGNYSTLNQHKSALNTLLQSTDHPIIS
ncbi:hypothetical protein NQ318_023164 [Aromia moschata]|uniref:Uncharacterized protein n=1 Tax=Aromia moschata TaxID=1265417 RepID=A0AAV8X8I3_9CUCU|nr:hypothetical protein NQ318_023164 [Aromia moschata]